VLARTAQCAPGSTTMSALSFTLLFRLPDGHRPQGSEWIDWQFGERIVPQSVYGDPHDEPPYKRYPGSHHYFAPQVEQTLFPRPTDPAEESGRWIRRPVSWWLAVGPGHTPTYELAVELLEIVRVELAPHVAYGVAHLNLVGHSCMDDMLGSARALMTRYRATDADAPSFELRTGSDAQPLLGNAPLASVAQALFGGAHPNVGRQGYAFVAAQIPEDLPEEDVAPWRRALGQGGSLDDARATLEERPAHDEHRMVRLGPTLATFYGRTAVCTYQGDRSAALRNVRSYWAETVLFALIQHAHIETYAIELGRLGGEPLGPAIDELFVRWLAFRNILWWQHPSFTTPEPRKILPRARDELKTEPLYEDLATAFATYVEARRHRAEDTESRALRALQVYGAAFAVVSTIAAVMQVLGESYVDTANEQIGYALMLSGVALAVILVVTLWIRRREKNA
jgi:hypothetical protein